MRVFRKHIYKGFQGQNIQGSWQHCMERSCFCPLLELVSFSFTFWRVAFQRVGYQIPQYVSLGQDKQQAVWKYNNFDLILIPTLEVRLRYRIQMLNCSCTKEVCTPMGSINSLRDKQTSCVPCPTFILCHVDFCNQTAKWGTLWSYLCTNSLWIRPREGKDKVCNLRSCQRPQSFLCQSTLENLLLPFETPPIEQPLLLLTAGLYSLKSFLTTDSYSNCFFRSVCPF